MIQHGGPENKSTLPLLASSYLNELSVQDGLIFKGERVVVPKAVRSGLPKSIHNSHLGVNGCLNIARERLYWPGMTGEIKNHVSTSEPAESTNRVKERKHSPATKHLVDRGSSLQQTHLLNGMNYVVTVDYFSHFLELDHLGGTSSVYVIKKFKGHFARLGIP